MQVSGILETTLSPWTPLRRRRSTGGFGCATLFETEKLIALNVAGHNVRLLFKKGATEEPATLPGALANPWACLRGMVC